MMIVRPHLNKKMITRVKKSDFSNRSGREEKNKNKNKGGTKKDKIDQEEKKNQHKDNKKGGEKGQYNRGTEETQTQ